MNGVTNLQPQRTMSEPLLSLAKLTQPIVLDHLSTNFDLDTILGMKVVADPRVPKGMGVLLDEAGHFLGGIDLAMGRDHSVFGVGTVTGRFRSDRINKSNIPQKVLEVVDTLTTKLAEHLKEAAAARLTNSQYTLEHDQWTEDRDEYISDHAPELVSGAVQLVQAREGFGGGQDTEHVLNTAAQLAEDMFRKLHPEPSQPVTISYVEDMALESMIGRFAAEILARHLIARGGTAGFEHVFTLGDQEVKIVATRRNVNEQPEPMAAAAWFQQLDEVYRDRAITNWKRGGRDRLFSSLNEALYYAFEWAETPEGHGFWQKLYLHHTEGKEAPLVGALPSPNSDRDYERSTFEGLASRQEEIGNGA